MFADMNSLEEGFLSERTEHAEPHILGEVNYAFDVIGINEANPKSRKRLDADWPVHGNKMSKLPGEFKGDRANQR